MHNRTRSATSSGRGARTAIGSVVHPQEVRERGVVREFARKLFSRTSGAPLREGNAVTLLKDAVANYPRWLEAIEGARRTVDFEMYIVHSDAQGRQFADALVKKARQGVRVRVLYDWMGAFGKTPRRFWRPLRESGAEVRCYNPPRFDRPLGWLSRDHRKMIAVDGEVAFVTGLCVGQAWVGEPSSGIEPWRDTGIELRGPSVADCAAAFEEAWAAAGNEDGFEAPSLKAPATAGTVAVRVVATVPNTAGLLRVDQLVAAMAERTLWLTDAYFGGTTSYLQALRAAAEDGVDVRLLVPGSSDIPALRLFSRAGYRPLLEAGVRVFEWDGLMLHAKTAVADGHWARVGSTNLNIASWMGNRELDVIVEDEGFARQMEAMYVEDLHNATEIVLDLHHRLRRDATEEISHGPSPLTGSNVRSAGARRRPVGEGGSGGRAFAGAMRIGHTVGAAITNRRVLEPVEAHIALVAGGVLAGLCTIGWLFPRAIAYPLAVGLGWLAAALIYRGFVLRFGTRDRIVVRPADDVDRQPSD